jgi:hypothetical protein
MPTLSDAPSAPSLPLQTSRPYASLSTHVGRKQDGSSRFPANI